MLVNREVMWGWLGLLALVGCGAAASGGGSGQSGRPPEEPNDVVAGAPAVSACAEHVSAGVAHIEAGEPLAAERSLMRAVRADRECVAAYLNLAVVQRQTERLDEALGNVRRALALDSENVHAFHQLVLVHLAEARDDVGALDLAGLACRQGLQIDGGFAPLHNACGIVDVERGRVVDALARFERAYTLDPRLYEAWMNFGQITLSFRGYEDAERAFRGALEALPEDEAQGSAGTADTAMQRYDALVGLGVALRGLHRVEEARARYEEARALAPERPEAWYDLGILHQDHLSGDAADLARAEVFLETFVRKADGDPTFADEVDEVLRCCPDGARAHARRECRPGRLQNLRQAMHAMGAPTHEAAPNGC